VTSRPSKRIVAVVAAAALLGLGGVALAQTQRDDHAVQRQAFLDDTAKRLGVDSSDLEQALRDATIAQIDKALGDGAITKEQADRMKERIQSGDGPLFGLPLERGFRGHGGFGPGGHDFELHHGPPAFFDAAATYLGMTTDELFTALGDGTSLADLAKEKGKSVDGLEQAIVAAVEKQLDVAVGKGRLTEEQKTEFLDRLRDHVDELVQRAGDGPHRFRHDGTGPGGMPGDEMPVPGSPGDASL
jgi:hypothetical protein